MFVEAAVVMEGAIGSGPVAEENGLAGAGTILLVEDEAFVRDVTCEVLQAAGYRVVSAKNSAEGFCLHDLHCSKIDLLIADVILPGESGQALAGRLRERDPGLNVLFVTGYVEQMGRREDQSECLAKPFSSRALLERVGQMIGR